jgi:hypothetical protein
VPPRFARDGICFADRSLSVIRLAAFLSHPHRLFPFRRLNFASQKHGDATLLKYLGGVVISVIGVIAAHASERLLVETIIRVSVAARGTLLRRMMGRNLDR